jgi:hypothetical protein
MTPQGVLRLQASAGNAAVGRMLARDPKPVAAPADPVKGFVDAFLDYKDTEALMRSALAAGSRWDDVQREWSARGPAIPLLVEAERKLRGKADAMRIYAYLRFGQLRLADKLAIAGAGLGTDNDTIFRLLPAVHDGLAGATGEFTASYGQAGGDAFGAEYPKDGRLVDGTENRIAGFLEDEMSMGTLAKARVLLSRGTVRPIDELWIALQSFKILSGDIMPALEKVAAAYPTGPTTPIQADYRATYHEELFIKLSEALGGAGTDNMARAKLILSGDYTLANRIKLACEGVGTALKDIWTALESASLQERKKLYAEDWSQNGEIRKLVEGEMQIWEKDRRRIESWLRGGEGIDDVLVQFGVEVTDYQGVIGAAFRDRRVGDAFRAEYPKRDSAFRKAFTGEERVGAAMLWGDAFVSKDWRVRLRLAVDLDAEEGVLSILTEDVKTDAERASIDPGLTARLKGMKAWPRIEPLIVPKDDLQARADWMGEKGKDAGSAGGTAAAAAFADEKRALDAGLAGVKDPHHLTPEERTRLGPLAAATEASLETLMRVRDELDAIAIQVVGTVAGLAATALTGGTAGPLTASLLARAALAQACASASAVWVVKGDRATGGEVAHAFAVGAATGMGNVLGASAALKAIPAGAAADAAKGVAATQFPGVGASTLRGALEGAAGGGAGAAVDAGARSETWKQGFVEGLKGGAQGAAIAGAIHPLRAALFGAPPQGGGAGAGDAPPPAPPKLEPIHIERAKVMLQAGEGIDFKRWQTEILPAFAEYEPIARQALAQARRQLVEQAIARSQAELTELGVTAQLPPPAGFDTPLDVEFVPAPGRPSAEAAPAAHKAILKVRQQLGEGVGERAGVRLRGQGEGPGNEDWSDVAQALGTSPARVVPNWTLGGEWSRVKPAAYELVFGSKTLPDINRPRQIQMTLGHIVEKTSTPLHSLENLLPQLNAVNVKLAGIFATKPFRVRIDGSTEVVLQNLNGKPITGSLRDAFGSGTFTVDEQRAMGYFLLEQVLAAHPEFEPRLAELVAQIPALMEHLRVPAE